MKYYVTLQNDGYEDYVADSKVDTFSVKWKS